MASQGQHLKQAQHNEAFLASFELAKSLYLDWALTAAFYAALHYLRALMAKYGYMNVSSYGDMDKAFDRLSLLKNNPAVHDAYRQLKDDSRSARYNMWKPGGGDVVDARDEMVTVRDFIVPSVVLQKSSR
jgi:HEPN domain-containing protein